MNFLVAPGTLGATAVRPARRRVCTAMCAKDRIQGIAFRTGEKLLLEEVKADDATENSVYVRCEVCSTCYRVKYPVPKGILKCSECGAQWDGSRSPPLRRVEKQAISSPVLPTGKSSSQPLSSLKRNGPSSQLKCQHFKECPGCVVERKFDDTRAVRDALTFCRTRLAAGKVDVVLGSFVEWRTNAKLAVRSVGKQLGVGLYQFGTHDLVEIPDCRVHHQQINIVAAAVKKAANEVRVAAYDEKTRSGGLRYLHMLVERSSGQVALTLIWNASTVKESNPSSGRLVRRLWEQREEIGLHSIWMNLNNSAGNAVMAPEPNRWKLMHGKGYVTEKILDATVCFLPSTFRQANLEAFERLLESLVGFVPDGSRVTEFCAGVGAIGLAVLSRRKLKSLVCTEVNALSEDAFDRSLALLPAELAGVAEFEVGTAAALRDRLAEADIAIADPPRQGLDFQFLEFLCAPRLTRPKRFIYVSCGLESFKRDAERLLKGGWKATHVEAHVFFPGSNHVEMLAVFDWPKATTS